MVEVEAGGDEAEAPAAVDLPVATLTSVVTAAGRALFTDLLSLDPLLLPPPPPLLLLLLLVTVDCMYRDTDVDIDEADADGGGGGGNMSASCHPAVPSDQDKASAEAATLGPPPRPP